MSKGTYRNCEYDNYPVPEKIVPLTDENRKEYEEICEKARRVIKECLEAARNKE